MEVKNSVARFDQASAALCLSLREILGAVPNTAKRTAQEIRLRVGVPIAITCPGQTWFVGSGGELNNLPRQGYIVTKQDLADSILTMCSHSVHVHQEELRCGFLSLAGGHRAGVCGTAVYSGGAVSAVRNITSVNLRIAREVGGAATPLVERCFRERLCGVLIAGPPSSGKTTILRDLAYQLSSGGAGRIRRVTVVDERLEIAAVYEGAPQNHLGPSCDVLSGYAKGEGILMAVRTMSPEVIVCDEIGSREEVDSILDGLNCGVKVIATAHAGSLGELLRRGQIRRLLEQGVFDQIVLLEGGDTPGQIRDILEVRDLLGEGAGNGAHRSMLYDDGNFHGIRLVQTCGRD